MKARIIKKLHKEIEQYKSFKVAQSFEPFGTFYIPFEYASGGLKADLKIIKAKDEVHSIIRWLKWYERYNKEKSKFHFTTSFVESSSTFAHFKVIDEKGLIKYYR